MSERQYKAQVSYLQKAFFIAFKRWLSEEQVKQMLSDPACDNLVNYLGNLPINSITTTTTFRSRT